MSQKHLPTNGQGPRSPKSAIRAPENFAPTFAMTFIIGVMIVVIFFVLVDRDPDTIVIDPSGDPAEAFNATTALDYADRVSRIAEITVSGALTLALGLVGFGWLSTNARIERDRQELAEHKAELDKRSAERVESLEKQINNLEARIVEFQARYSGDQGLLETRLGELASRLPELSAEASTKPGTSFWGSMRSILQLFTEPEDLLAKQLEQGEYASAITSYSLFLTKLNGALTGLEGAEAGLEGFAPMARILEKSDTILDSLQRLEASVAEISHDDLGRFAPARAQSLETIALQVERFKGSKLDQLVQAIQRVEDQIQQRLSE